ncbi:cyclomaltodextrinase C-terminal domain-containing protein, partial [Bacteroidia bacterium]|nr:cyclomaltodextrinase C-terminal domain-containing protein [Bacteroidia bacterium]
RFYTQVGKDLNKFKMGMGIVYTMRGIPQVYYGTEALFANEKRGDHGEIRKEFDGGWDDHSINIFENRGLTTDQKEAKDFIQSLGKFRKNSTAIHKGKLLHFTPQNNVYVFFRYTSTEVVMVVINKKDKEIKLDLNEYNEVLADKESMKYFTASTFNKKPSFLRIEANEIGIYSLE